MKRLILYVLWLYKSFLSPLLPPSCRFAPTCSDYMAIAIHRFGVIKGLYLGFRRLLRCHPWNPGGYDPVPWNTREKRSDNKGHSFHP